MACINVIPNRKLEYIRGSDCSININVYRYERWYVKGVRMNFEIALMSIYVGIVISLARGIDKLLVLEK